MKAPKKLKKTVDISHYSKIVMNSRTYLSASCFGFFENFKNTLLRLKL